jgi:hypothetical protein
MTSHNHAPVAQAELTDSEKEMYSIAKLNEWRTLQYERLSELRKNSGFALDGSYVREFNDTVDSTLDDYLTTNGIDSASPNYDEVRQLFRDASIDTFTEDEWGNSPASRGLDPNDHTSESDKFEARIKSRFETDSDDAASPVELSDAERQARDAEFEALETQLNEARELWAAASAKRQGRFFDLPSKKRDALKKDYEAKLYALGHRHMAEHDEYDDEMKNVIATTILFDEQEKLRNLTTEKLQGTKVTKIIQWMNRGNTATRIAKGVGVGVAAGLAGSFLAGAIGAGIVAGGTVIATRFARGFALKDADKRGMERYVQDDNGVYQGVDYQDYEVSANTDSMTNDERMKSFAGVADDGFEEDTAHEQEKRRKAALYGTAMIGSGALIGYGIHELAERASDMDLNAVHWLHNRWNDFWSTDTTPGPLPNTVPHTPQTPGTSHVPGTEHLHHANGDHSDLVGDTNADSNVVTVDLGHGYTHELIDFATANAQHLTPEQAYQLHLALVDHFGPDYINIDGPGHDIYFDHGDVRLAEPGVGRWEQGVPAFSMQWMSSHGLWSQSAS